MKRVSENCGIDNHKDNTKENVLEIDIPQRKRRTSPVWEHLNINFSVEKKTEFAYCKHCDK